MRIAIGILMVLHGVAHLVGFVGAWGLSASIPSKTTIFGGHVDLGAVGIRIAGLIWLGCAVAFGAAGVATTLHADGWPTAALVLASVSLLVCVTELPAAKIGVAVDLAILALLLAGPRTWWT